MMKHDRIDPASGPAETRRTGEGVCVHERMSRPAVTVVSSTSLDEALRLMAAHRIHYLVVVDSDASLVGIVNADDVRGTRRSAGPRPESVGAVMSMPAVSIGPSAALRLMADREIGALPVVEGGRVVGILTQSDIVTAQITECEAPLPADIRTPLHLG
jgi:CBS domain-containing protein